MSQSLLDRFAAYVPTDWLEAIAHRAKAVVSEELSPIQQLIECVKPLLTQWSEDDLQVFARPLVYAMRGAVETKQAPWEELSEIERVRLTLMIAQEAIRETEINQEID